MSTTAPAGFRAAAATAGLKASGRPDVALVVNDGPLDVLAAVFTRNRCKANPVLWSEQVARTGRGRAVVLNSGGANCYTGPQGFEVTHATAELVARELGARGLGARTSGVEHGGTEVGAAEVLVCSTGLIGEQLDRERLLAGVSAAVAGLDVGGGDDAAVAIMTTDTVPKTAVRTAAGWSAGGMAKGAGMLAPALATMLVVLTTDAVVQPADADAALRAATAATFDRLDSDGCQSTNDTVALMASGASGVRVGTEDLTAVLTPLCADLAAQLLRDAEGSEHDIAVAVRGAASEQDALEVARSIARSSLFKAAVFGRDPNWGRVMAAVGTTGATFDPAVLDVSFNGVAVCRDGAVGEPRHLVDLTAREVDVTVDLKAGGAAATIWTNDLTHAYVHENSAYSS